jgi:hypothetical protein
MQLLFIKTKGPTGSDHNPLLFPRQIFDSFMVSRLVCCLPLSSVSELLPLLACVISFLASSNEGPNSSTSSRDLFLTSWKFYTLSCHFLARSEVSTTNCWVVSAMHFVGLDTTREFHSELAMASTWCICR